MTEQANIVRVGRRKEAKARVKLVPGSGKITVNGVISHDYFNREILDVLVRQPLKITQTLGKYDVVANLKGGGKSGQAGAFRHAISRALAEIEPKQMKVLRKAGFLTRDSRMVERKKYGQRGARARFQFSKR